MLPQREPASKMNAYGLSALEIVQIRITLSLIFVGVYLLLFHREYLKIRLKDLWCFIGTGLVSQLAFSWFDFIRHDHHKPQRHERSAGNRADFRHASESDSVP